MLRKINAIDRASHKTLRLVSQILREKQDTDEDLTTRLNHLQRMRFAYMGRNPAKGKEEK